MNAMTLESSLLKGNYFALGDYFNLNPGKGEISTRDGVRLIAFPHEFTVGLLEGLEDEVGQAWPVVMYRCGQWWGRRQMRRLNSELSQYYNQPLDELPTSQVHGLLRQAWAVQGWGRLDINLEHINHGLMHVRVFDAPIASVFKKTGRDTHGQPVDSLIAGALTGMFSQATDASVSAWEIECSANGAEACRFIVGLEGKLAEVPGMVRKGVSADDIVAALSVKAS